MICAGRCGVCGSWVTPYTTHFCGGTFATPSTPPAKLPVYPTPATVCQRCGALIGDWTLHGNFHALLDNLREATL